MNIYSFYINKKNKFIQNILLFFMITILSYFLVFSNTNFKIMSDIIEVFINILLPSLFPYILLSNILSNSGCFELIATSKLNVLIQKIFKTSSYGASAIIFGFLFGYPNGAKYVNDLYSKKKISYKEGEYLLLFVNNASPTFILSSVGIGMFKNIRIGILLLLIHIISSVIIGILYSCKYKLYCKLKKENVHIDNNYNNCVNTLNLSFNTIYESISKSLITMGIIFGFMTIFILLHNYLITLININKTVSICLLPFMEISSGLKQISYLNIDLNILLTLTSLFLGFSSLSIILQLFSCIYTSNFKLKILIKGKLLHGILSCIITYILVNIPIVYQYINTSKTVNNTIDKTFNANTLYTNHIFISLLIFLVLSFFTYIFVILKRKRLTNC